MGKLALSASGSGSAAVQLGELSTRLEQDRRLAERVETVAERAGRSSGRNMFGEALSGIAVLISTTGTATALAQVVRTWLVQRKPDVTLKISNGTRSVELTAQRVPDLDGLVAVIRDLAQGG